MNKKSAMAIAGGLVAALASTLGAVSASLTNGTTPQAQAEPAQTAKPIVRTIHRTVTVHKKPKHNAAPQIVSVAPASTATSVPVTHSSGSVSAGHESDDEGEHEYGDD